MFARLLTIGSFDTPHMGHAAFLRRCSAIASQVIVGVNSDVFIKKYKGAEPVFNELERCRLIEELGYRTFLNQSAGRELIVAVRPDVVAIGSDWFDRDYAQQIDTTGEFLAQSNIAVIYLPYTSGISTSLLKERLGR